MNNHPFQCLGLVSMETATHLAFTRKAKGTEEYMHGEGLAAGLKGLDRIQLLLSSKPLVTQSLTSC